MMKNICKGAIWGLLAFSLLQTSCKEEFEYTPASLQDGGNVYIASNSYNMLEYKGNDPLTFQIQLKRSNTDKDEKVKLISDNKEIPMPDNIMFKEGEQQIVVNVPFRSNEASTHKVNIKLAPENASHYGLCNTTFQLDHYKNHKIDYQSGWFKLTLNDIELYEAGNKNYVLYLPLQGVDKKNFLPIRFEVNEKNEVYLHPQPVYVAKDNNGNQHLLYVVGNWNGDASQKFNDADIKKVSCFAGMYHSEKGLFQLNFFWYAPNFGWWGWDNENFVFTD